MKHIAKSIKWGSLALVIALAGCASAARDTSGFAITDEATVNAPFEKTWQLTKAVLREQNLDIYTRDKRGFFVAFTPQKRHWRLVPHRQKYTITIEEVSATATHISIETVNQVYGVTLLTYPDWHDRKATGDTEAKAILKALQAKAAGA